MNELNWTFENPFENEDALHHAVNDTLEGLDPLDYLLLMESLEDE